ncbi:hypothetical protein NK6_9392 [Bradyrhizobium diazoefficiens]|uniref:Uncharacterized protein n=2 Tax=Bradyrhizobium diazoefficiens TaxID=1355477 RepID=A0A837CN84_9BRAD|nr:hypothetical protein BJA5080_06600 [Bradyrhizobium diazoefficiens SEMIA 5080]BAR62531.1 hypothetical protein NK6_9392 [Bradyrhizobium diazoefficiens]
MRRRSGLGAGRCALVLLRDLTLRRLTLRGLTRGRSIARSGVGAGCRALVLLALWRLLLGLSRLVALAAPLSDGLTVLLARGLSLVLRLLLGLTSLVAIATTPADGLVLLPLLILTGLASLRNAAALSHTFATLGA